MFDWESRYASRASWLAASDIRERMKLIGTRDLIHLGGGLPDPELFPVAMLREAAERIFADPGKARQALQYAPSEGHPPLRAWIAERISRQGAACTPDNVLVTNGSQQALDFVAKLLISPGDPVMVEVPSFIGALRAFDVYEPNYVALTPEALAAGTPAKFAYAGPDFRNPTGTTMTLAEREALVEAAGAANMAILEDSCYQDLRFEGADLPSLLAVATARYGSIKDQPVLHAGTISKTIAPSMRVGWVVGPQEVIRKLVLIKQASDLAVSALNQMLFMEIADRLDEAAATARALYRERRDSMLAALAAEMPEGVSWTRPEGGLYIWVTLPDHVDASAFAKAALVEENVVIIAGAAFYPRGDEGRPGRTNTVRLSFSMIGEEPAREAIRRLGALARRMV